MELLLPVKNLRRRSARTVLLVIGVALSITLTTIMFAIGEGINSSTRELINETNIELFIYPKSSNPILQEFTKYLDMEDGRELAAKIRNGNPLIRAASPWLNEELYITSGKAEGSIPAPNGKLNLPKVYSIDGKGYVPELQGEFGAVEQVAGTDLPTRTDPFYANGTYAGGSTSRNFTHEVVLNKFLAELLKIGVGDIVYISGLGLPLNIDNASFNAWFANTSWFRISGIILERYEPPSILTANMHLSEIQYLTGKHRADFFGIVRSDFVNEIYVDLYSPKDTDAVKAYLENEFEDRDRISVLTADDLTGEFSQFLDIFKGFSSMIILITTLVVILFVSTIMMISIQEQSREIGMLRAIGISKQSIIGGILIESTIICLIGFVLGLGAGVVAADALEHYILSTETQIPLGLELMRISPMLIVQISSITIIIGIMAGLLPAIWAATITPAESIRKV